MDDHERSSHFMEGKISQADYAVMIALHFLRAHGTKIFQISHKVFWVFLDLKERKNKRGLRGGGVELRNNLNILH